MQNNCRCQRFGRFNHLYCLSRKLKDSQFEVIMKKYSFVLVILCAVVLGVAGLAFAQTKRSAAAKAAPKGSNLVSRLPKSDAVFIVDMTRLMTEALPQMLATKPQYLEEFNLKLDEIKNDIGIDLRQFDELAVGIGYKTVSKTETDFEPVVLAKSKSNVSGFLGLAKLAAKGKYREETVGGKTIYIFSPKEILESNKSDGKSNFINKMVDAAMKSFKQEVAVTSIDDNTLAMGTLKRVSETVNKVGSVSPELTALSMQNSKYIIGFAAGMPAGASQFVNIDNDELGKNIESIRRMSGGLDMNDGKATLAVSAKTLKTTDAQGLEETLTGLQLVGKALLGGVKGDDKKLYARLIENAVIARKVNEVTVNLDIPRSDMSALMAILLK